MKNMRFRIICLWIFSHLIITMSAQTDPYEGLMEAIWLDSMTITAKKMGFDVNNFISLPRDTLVGLMYSFIIRFPHKSRQSWYELLLHSDEDKIK